MKTVKSILKGVGYLCFFVVFIEFVGLCGVLALRYTDVGNIPQGIRWMFPHPIFADVPELRTLDPNTVWYMQRYRFGKPRKVPPPKRAGEFRIFILGGSTVEGDGATKEEETIAYVLERILSKSPAFSCASVKVYNEGISAYASKQELLSVLLRIAPFQSPDFIVDLDGVNEFLTGAWADTALAKRYEFAQYWHPREASFIRALERLNTGSGAVLQALNVLARKFLTRTFIGLAFNYGYKVLISKEPDRPGFTLDEHMRGAGTTDWRHIPAVREDLIDYYFSNIRMMDALAENQNAHFLWALQPVLFYKNDPQPVEASVLKDRHYGPNFWAKFRQFYESAETRITPEHDNWVDMSSLFADSQDVDFVDIVHYSPIAQRKIAQALARLIEKRVDASRLCNK